MWVDVMAICELVIFTLVPRTLIFGRFYLQFEKRGPAVRCGLKHRAFFRDGASRILRYEMQKRFNVTGCGQYGGLLTHHRERLLGPDGFYQQFYHLQHLHLFITSIPTISDETRLIISAVLLGAYRDDAQESRARRVGNIPIARGFTARLLLHRNTQRVDRSPLTT